MVKNTDFIPVRVKNTKSRKIKILFYTLHFVYSLDFGYVKRTPRNKIWLHIYCFLYVLVSIINLIINAIYTDIDFTVICWIFTILIQHIFTSLALNFISDKSSFYALQKSLMSVDSQFNIKIHTDNKIILSCVCSVACRVITTYFFCTHFKDECVNSVLGASIAFFQELSSDMLLTIFFFVFYIVYLRLNIFKVVVKNQDIRILEALNVYKNLVDMVDKVKKIIDVLVSTYHIYLSVLNINSLSVL